MTLEPGLDPIRLLRPRRAIEGASAILLPFDPDGDVDWAAFAAHVERTAQAGLVPAVNMDTGFAHLIDEATRIEALRRTRELLGSRPFFAGAYVADRPGDPFAPDSYRRAMAEVAEHGGIPVVFPSFGLTALEGDDLVEAYRTLGRNVDAFLGFELGQDFAPSGRIYPIEVVRGLMEIRSCVGIKHSSLRRELEWLRLVERDRLRPDFRIYTGNDLAIDMVMYGSDYLLGLSTFAPDRFALRDRYWADGDARFYELNDQLQYLGWFAFRPPVPAYKHSAALFLKLRGWVRSDRTHPGSPTRPESDRPVLAAIARRLGIDEEV
jgi:dihydrodipicolinate synthase/N-acetylneuraminate lyase